VTREELEHIIRASAEITQQYEFVIIGSQSMLGAVPRPDARFTVSMEADIYPLQAPELADEIDGSVASRNSLGSISTLFLLPQEAAMEIARLLGVPSARTAPQKSDADTSEAEQVDVLYKDIQERAFEFTKDACCRCVSSIGLSNEQAH